MTFSFTDSFRMSAIVGIKLNLKRKRHVVLREGDGEGGREGGREGWEGIGGDCVEVVFYP